MLLSFTQIAVLVQYLHPNWSRSKAMASGKAKLMRKQRHQQRRKAQQGIQLTALMDVFTVLVFFLMVSQDDSTRLPQRADIHLPPAVVQTQPEESLTLQVSDEDRKSTRLNSSHVATSYAGF